MRLVRLLAAVTVVSSVALLLECATVSAQQNKCEGVRIVIEGGEPSPFVLPNGTGHTLKVAPDSVLHIRAEGFSPGSNVRWRMRGLGRFSPTFAHELDPGIVEVDMTDYSSYARGLYEIEGTLFAGEGEVCTVTLGLNLTGFGGVTAMAAATSAGLLGAATLGSIPFAAGGMSARLRLKVQVQRRRPQGWRRFIPVPAWKRTLTSTLTGALSGLCIGAVLQQGGFVPFFLQACGA